MLFLCDIVDVEVIIIIYITYLVVTHRRLYSIILLNSFKNRNLILFIASILFLFFVLFIVLVSKGIKANLFIHPFLSTWPNIYRTIRYGFVIGPSVISHFSFVSSLSPLVSLCLLLFIENVHLFFLFVVVFDISLLFFVVAVCVRPYIHNSTNFNLITSDIDGL